MIASTLAADHSPNGNSSLQAMLIRWNAFDAAHALTRQPVRPSSCSFVLVCQVAYRFDNQRPASFAGASTKKPKSSHLDSHRFRPREVRSSFLKAELAPTVLPEAIGPDSMRCCSPVVRGFAGRSQVLFLRRGACGTTVPTGCTTVVSIFGQAV